MVFLLTKETWVPSGQSQFKLEKWVPQETVLSWSDNGSDPHGDWRWSVPPYYRLLKLDGTELMDTHDWNHVLGFLQAVLGEQTAPHDFEF